MTPLPRRTMLVRNPSMLILRPMLAVCTLVCAVAAQSGDGGVTYIGVIKGADASVRGTMKMVAGGIAASNGAQIAAGAHNAVIHLTRGGDISVCRGSALTLNAHGSQLLLGLQAGTIEARYPLSAAPDSLFTADFRITVENGGRMPSALADYRIAMGTDGDLLVQVLPDSDAGVEVASVFDEVHANVRPGEMRAFVSSNSSRNAEQIAQTVALRCPLEQPATEVASAAEREPPTGKQEIEIPLAYQSAPLVPANVAGNNGVRSPISADVGPTTSTAAAPSSPARRMTPAPVAPAPRRAIETAQENRESMTAATTTPVTAPAAANPETHKTGVFHSMARFFRHLFRTNAAEGSR